MPPRDWVSHPATAKKPLGQGPPALPSLPVRHLARFEAGCELRDNRNPKQTF
jgi:hypothetical protein